MDMSEVIAALFTIIVLVTVLAIVFRDKTWVRVRIEKLSLWMLYHIHTEMFVVPATMKPYEDKIEVLVAEEEGKSYGSGDLFGDGYFKTRRVLAIMLRDHPELRDHKRELMKAVVVASDRVKAL